ncbi:hypothetical protein BL243_12310 [Ralstonia solanacearum]|nr:hypothetical protein BL243_12310 [Ralstonia solanacearum]
MFSPKGLLEIHRGLFSLADSDELIERSLKLQSVFQEYLVPTVTIAHRDIDEVVEIFRRINSTGTPLGAVDFMRALTWSQSFDLTSELAELSEYLRQLRFDLSDETLLKVIAVIAGRAPMPDDMLKLRNEPAEQLLVHVETAKRLLHRSIEFLRGNFWFQSSEFLPYEGQILALVKYFMTTERLATTPADETELVRWIWAVSLNEQLRGKPDHYVARQLREVEAYASGQKPVLSHRLTVSPAEFLERRLIKGKALSAAFASMFAVRQARSLITGEIIPPSEYLETFDPDVFVPLMPLESIERVFGKKFSSPRLFSNLVLVSGTDMAAIRNGKVASFAQHLEANFGHDGMADILASQFLDEQLLRDIESVTPSLASYEQRAKQLHDFANHLVGN